jgi:hypothetical protein
MGKRRNVYKVSAEKLERTDHLEELGTERRIILKCIFKKQNRGVGRIHLTQDKETWQDGGLWRTC